MSSSKVHALEEHRLRRTQRLDRAFALNRGSAVRSALAEHVAQLLRVTRGERAAAVWVDEYEGTRAHPFLMLDLTADRPRKDLPVDLFLRCWEAGVPAIHSSSGTDASESDTGGWAVSLGSDGVKLWFLYVDSARVTSLPMASRERVMFLAGECAALLLHRDLDPPEDLGWGGGAATDTRGSLEAAGLEEAPTRRVVAALARRLIDQGPDARSVLVSKRMLAESGHAEREGDDELQACLAVVRAIARGDASAAALALLRVARAAEDTGAFSESVTINSLAYELACASGAVREGGQAARGRARALRRLALWDDSLHWYEVARGIASSLCDQAEEAIVLDGVASTYIGRGRVPTARTILNQARKLAQGSGDADAIASVSFSLMTVAHTEGRLAEAARHGWNAFLEFRTSRGKLRALTALGGVFLAAGHLDSADDAFAIVERDGQDRHYRLYALAGLARVKAARGDLHGFEQANRRLGKEGLGESAPEFRAEVYLERGDGYRELGVEAEARRWYRVAMRFSERHGVSEYLIRAEQALRDLDAGALGTGPARELPESRSLDVIRRDLGALRGQPTSAEAIAGADV
jgi:tetratricopeptide (TPR) repeat protein